MMLCRLKMNVTGTKLEGFVQYLDQQPDDGRTVRTFIAAIFILEIEGHSVSMSTFYFGTVTLQVAGWFIGWLNFFAQRATVTAI